MKTLKDYKPNIHSKSLIERSLAIKSGDINDLTIALLDNNNIIRQLAHKKMSGKQIEEEDLQKIFIYENVEPTLSWFHEVRLSNSLTERETKEEIKDYLMMHLDKFGYTCKTVSIDVRDKYWTIRFQATASYSSCKNISVSLTLSP